MTNPDPVRAAAEALVTRMMFCFKHDLYSCNGGPSWEKEFLSLKAALETEKKPVLDIVSADGPPDFSYQESKGISFEPYRAAIKIGGDTPDSTRREIRTPETSPGAGVDPSAPGEFDFADGCCSAIHPCSHQQQSPSTICEVCRRAGRPEPSAPGDGWIPWSGGGCPLKEYDRPEVRYRSGGTTEQQATYFRWNHTGAWDDVLAYRIRRARDGVEAQRGLNDTFPGDDLHPVTEPSAPGEEELEIWIKREFAGYGMAMDHPTSEPVMSMRIAKMLVRRAVDFLRPAIEAKAAAAERERILKVILGGSFLSEDAPVALWAKDLAAAIERDAALRERKNG